MTTTHRLPEGKISLLFTDIEDSSRMNNALGDPVYNASMRVPHNERIRTAIAPHGGYEVKTIGDSFMIAFTRTADALACAVAIQAQLIGPAITSTDKTSKTWTVKVRIGVHTAEKELFPDESGDYHGADVNFAARVESLGVGGQLIVSDAAYSAANWEHSHQWKAWPDRRIKSFD